VLAALLASSRVDSGLGARLSLLAAQAAPCDAPRRL
jgi:hypothetical protein